MEQRITTLEALIPSLATRSDLNASVGALHVDFERLRADVNKTIGDMRTDFERGQKENRAWMLGTVLALFVGILGAGSLFVSVSGKQGSAPQPQPQPIVIYAQPLHPIHPVQGEP